MYRKTDQDTCSQKHKNYHIFCRSVEGTNRQTYNIFGVDLDKEMFKRDVFGGSKRIIGLVLKDGSVVKPETVVAVNSGDDCIVINRKSSNRRERMDTLIPIKRIERIEFRSVVEF